MCIHVCIYIYTYTHIVGCSMMILHCVVPIVVRFHAEEPWGPHPLRRPFEIVLGQCSVSQS